MVIKKNDEKCVWGVGVCACYNFLFHHIFNYLRISTTISDRET